MQYLLETELVYKLGYEYLPETQTKLILLVFIFIHVSCSFVGSRQLFSPKTNNRYNCFLKKEKANFQDFNFTCAGFFGR